MKNLRCQKRQRIIKRSKDGGAKEKYRCVNNTSEKYRHDVTESICKNCTLRRPLLKLIATCKECAPSAAIWPEPSYQDTNIVYSSQEGAEQPPIPEGYVRKADGWQFESKWGKCPYRQFTNQRAPKGNLQVQAHCDAQYEHVVSYEDCKKCLTAIVEIGGNLDEQFVKDSIPLPEAIKKRLGKKGIPTLPGVSESLDTYWKAVKRWIAGGRPVRGPEEVKQIHKDFCAPCDWYDAESQRCKGCGCVVKPQGVALLNKIKMQTEHCPRNFW